MILTRGRRRTLAATLLTTAALTYALAGCSTEHSDAAGELKQGDAKAVYADWQDKFHGCLKQKGFDLSKVGDKSMTAAELQPLDAAASACYKVVGNPPPDPSVPSAAELNASMLKFAKCMRAAGYDYPDPKIDPNGGIAMSQAMPASWNKADIDRCSKDAGLGGGSK